MAEDLDNMQERSAFGPDAADDGDLVPRLLETPRGLREEHAAARAVGLLRADGEDLHVRFPPSSIDRRPMVSHRGPDRKTPDARHVRHLLQWARTMRRAAKRVRRKDSSMGSSIPYLTLDPEIEAAIRADRAAGRSSRFRTADEDVVRREPNPHDEATLARPAFARDIEKILNVPAYNRYAPYLMTSVDTDPRLAAREREALMDLLGSGTWTVFGGHGPAKVFRL